MYCISAAYEDPPPTPLCGLARPAGWRFESIFIVTGHTVVYIIIIISVICSKGTMFKNVHRDENIVT